MISMEASNQPPVGKFFISYEEDGYYPGWGQVLGAPGGGYLFCVIFYCGTARRKMVPPDVSANWRFFETQDECARALPHKSWRQA